jgi:hypothetical protein
MVMVTGLLGLIVLIFDIAAIFKILNSKVSGGAKILWCLLILVLPVLGLLIWFVAGPKN